MDAHIGSLFSNVTTEVSTHQESTGHHTGHYYDWTTAWHGLHDMIRFFKKNKAN